MTGPLATIALSYLVGSIPFSYVVARIFGIEDIRKTGSGNVGATNVLRAAGRLPGLAAFVLDAGKGAVAVAVAGRFDAGGLLPALAAVSAVLGHIFPIWLGFRGGKGVATGAGALAPVAPFASLGAVATFLLVLLFTRYVSLGSMLGALALAVLLLVTEAPRPVRAAGVVLAAIVIARHKQNVERLVAGQERRIGAKP